MAIAWIVDETPTHADAIVVLGGGVPGRALEAARLYHRGIAPKILLTNAKPSPIAKLGMIPPETELTMQVLLKQGIPETNCIVIGNAVSSTFEEARAVRAWMEWTGARSAVIPTGLFHTRRVRWIFRKQLGAVGGDVIVSSLMPGEYGPANWWCCEEGLVSFQNELIKYAYYRLNY